MSILNDKLLHLTTEGKLVEVYRDRIAREAMVGRIRQSSAYAVIVERVDELYRYDGVGAIRLKDITRIMTSIAWIAFATVVAAGCQTPAPSAPTPAPAAPAPARAPEPPCGRPDPGATWDAAHGCLAVPGAAESCAA